MGRLAFQITDILDRESRTSVLVPAGKGETIKAIRVIEGLQVGAEISLVTEFASSVAVEEVEQWSRHRVVAQDQVAWALAIPGKFPCYLKLGFTFGGAINLEAKLVNVERYAASGWGACGSNRQRIGGCEEEEEEL